MQRDVQTIVNPKTIVDHCPQNFENHRKTIDTNGWALKKHSMVMVQQCQNHWKTIEVNGGLKKKSTIPSLWKIDHRCGLTDLFHWCFLLLRCSFIRPTKSVFICGARPIALLHGALFRSGKRHQLIELNIVHKTTTLFWCISFNVNSLLALLKSLCRT